ncbi:acyl-CoA thioesterase/bile acid-CoA:amino acid N-acyltransferase family protein [Streptomyces sp. NPDC086766]|uniref:acyl-CoA thioesterase/bile acid-CoA:amino acid N-acyltransferase family protein n=1 Tax=Streptomyces sp. NPDC086766 TaxID=3365754 RepID=UPI00382984AF
MSVIVAWGAAGCSSARPVSTRAAIDVDMPVALVDQPVHMRITHLAPHDRIVVGSSATAYNGQVWGAKATFTADDRGVVDLTTSRPESGTYNKVDGMGLFWSMRPPSGDPDLASFAPLYPDLAPSYKVRIGVTAHGRSLAGRTLTREWARPGVQSKDLSLAHDKLLGKLFLPPPGTPRHPAVLAFGGSEGGVGMKFEAALLASHGYPTLSLGYFRMPGLPATLRDIPLEYFATAAHLLAAQPSSDPAHIIAMGYSRGSEAALLLAEHYPQLVHGAVVYSPSSTVFPGFPEGGDAWTYQGRPIPQSTIPLDHLSGPVLSIAGADDALWASPAFARQIAAQLDDNHDRHPHQSLIYPGAGHGVGTFPYLARAVSLTNPTTGRNMNLGGSRAADAAAREQGWPRVLSFLANASQ